MWQALLLVPLLACLPAFESTGAGARQDNDSDPLIHRVHNKFSAVKNISKRDVACPQGKYQSGENCCDRCEPGYVKVNDCTASTKTICKKCEEEKEYMDFSNYHSKCFRCSSCDAEYGLEVDKPCNSSQNVRCRCKRGFYCNSSEPCPHCDPCTNLLRRDLGGSKWHPRGPEPKPILVKGQKHHEVKEILDSKIQRGILYYLVHWCYFPPSCDEWVKASDLNAPQLLKQFYLLHPDKP